MEERRTGSPQPNASELQGPYVVNLRIPHKEGKPEIRGRFFLGGGTDAREQVENSMDAINRLPDGLGWDELRQSAIEIFSSHGLVRVDF